jgi:hypothetical protein
MHINKFTTAMLFSLKKPYTLTGFEPGLYVPRADAMANAPRQNYKRFNVRAIFEIKVVVVFFEIKESTG